MASEIRVPQLGESVVEATIARWLKNEGDALAIGDPVVELETEKVNVEVPAEAPGVLTQIVHREGETVRVGQVLGVLDGQPGSPAPGAGPAGQHPTAHRPRRLPQRSISPPRRDGTRRARCRRRGRGQVTPVARRLAEEHGIDPSRLAGSGQGGRVMKEDVLGLIDQPAPPAPPDRRSSDQAPAPPAPTAPTPAREGRGEERVRLSRRRLTIARRLVEAQHSAALLTTFNEIDMSAVMEMRKRRRDSFKERHGVGLGFMSFSPRSPLGRSRPFRPSTPSCRAKT